MYGLIIHMHQNKHGKTKMFTGKEAQKRTSQNSGRNFCSKGKGKDNATKSLYIIEYFKHMLMHFISSHEFIRSPKPRIIIK